MARRSRGRGFQPRVAQAPHEPQQVVSEQVPEQAGPHWAPELMSAFANQAAGAAQAIGFVDRVYQGCENHPTCPEDVLDELETLRARISDTFMQTGKLLGELNSWANQDAPNSFDLDDEDA